MKSIEIVTHCWSGPKVPIYHRLLQIQLGSIINHKPTGLNVKVAVFCAPSDVRTVDVLTWFISHYSRGGELEICGEPVSKRNLFRRAIGRNKAAKSTEADVVWFTDCDYAFLDDCLLRAYGACLASSENMVFPTTVHIHRMHTFGDVLIDKLEQSPMHPARIDREHFEPRKERRAIGGIQIVKGDWCRKFGYLDGTKWVRPVTTQEGFRSCKGDVPFRKAVGQSEGVDIPGVYRLRHSKAGRDGGTVDHGAKTRIKE